MNRAIPVGEWAAGKERLNFVGNGPRLGVLSCDYNPETDKTHPLDLTISLVGQRLT
jgi:hypothetical protein